ncbi:uncharacterized protein LOC132604381 isoform X1 [Lycium barbarum]|uniref:uncharacterized protein LOC132604381 isoform X1 n=1 Tax=Lycium barbarum TaxID=112863 RepID=UPI00293E01BF|nr:uncharacterized protein LOC132604381 isoform X1 [Lycium barbarum]
MDSKVVEQEIQHLPLEQGTERPLDESKEKERRATIKDEIFQASMGNKWTKVQQLYINNEFVRESKLTKSEDTTLHLAISSYHQDRDDLLHHPHLTCIKEMIASIPKENRLGILIQKNEKGNTPLHLAAELGSVPIIECLVNSEDPTLIRETNSKGETPLFIAAYQGKLKAFLYLHKCVQDEKKEGPVELCRREDGDNILHAAISGEYFEVAFQIIHYYPPLVNYYNTEGMSPLHFLSKMPQVFRSGSHFRFIDSIIYYCINIDELELMTYEAEGKGDFKLKLRWNLPENYQALAEFLELLWNGTRIIRDYIKETNFGCQGKMSRATTKATNVNPEKSSPGHQSYRQNDPENPPIKDTTGATNENQEKKSPDTTGAAKENQEKKSLDTIGATNENKEKKSPAEGKRNGKLFPANYTIFIEFLKCLTKIVLVVLGIGLQRIKKLEVRKRQHTWGVQIMKLMIDNEKRYKFYESTGEEPEDRDHHSQDLAPPTEPPLIVEDDNKKDEDQSKTAVTKQSPTASADEKKKDDHKSELSKPNKDTPLLEEASRMGIVEMVEKVLKIFPTAIQDTDSKELSKPTKETPLLVASRMGIVEMVKKILKNFPIAIQDTDSEDKNLLLLAVEHRQTEVYNWLIGEKYPEYVFYQVDRKGNNAVHLAARYQKLEVWRIPGTALQLQGERKWYKYVKQTLPPQSYVRYNKKGQTPRQVFIETHAKLLKDGTEWLVTTANSFSVVAALIATVAFATSSQIPGGSNESGYPNFENQPAFDVFSISSLVSLCFSVTALVFFLAILTSRCQHNNFEKELPRKLLLGLTSLFASITAILISFCAAHFFVLRDKFKNAAFPIYAATCIPVVFFALNQFPLYVDLIRSYIQKRPLRSYKVFYTDSSVADQKKEGKEKED